MLERSSVQIVFGARQFIWQVKPWQQMDTRGLPSQVGSTAAIPGGLAMCAGPREWLVVARELESGAVGAQIQNDFADRGAIALDVTDALAVLEVQGASARELLSKGCGLDLHVSAFRVGQCARTRFAQIPVLLLCFETEERFELYAGRSYAQYLYSWLSDAAAGLVGAQSSPFPSAPRVR